MDPKNIVAPKSSAQRFEDAPVVHRVDVAADRSRACFMPPRSSAEP
jgi:hypothetical protein